jgi:dipeptidyl aminopeptidase/acylaminoacyl peptidase
MSFALARPLRLVHACAAIAFLLACAGSSPALCQAKAELPPIGAFFSAPLLGSTALSPNGKMLALQMRLPNGRVALRVIELESKRIHEVAGFTDANITTISWVNNERLVYVIDHYFSGAYAANFDGSKPVSLVSGARDNRAPLPPGSRLFHTAGAGNSNAFYFVRVKNGFQRLALVDTLSGDVTITPTPDDTKHWMVDHEGVLRMYLTETNGVQSVFYRNDSADPWRPAPNLNTSTLRGVRMLGFGSPGSLLVKSTNGGDKDAVYALDIASGKLSAQPLIVIADYDFAGNLILNKDKLLGFRVTTDAESTIWIDPAMKALQEEVDQRQPNTVNMITPPSRPEAPWVMVEAYSDRQPKVVLVYNTATKAFTEVGKTFPAIHAAQMGRQETVTYKARDGRMIPALLTRPAGDPQGKAPMVMLVHGGPWVRGNAWGWNPQTQFLASRGYAVLEPNFRGSTGFGNAHFKAGFKQWGRAMQDDLADGATWAISQDIADPQRICIAGGSYGGYATLMGLVNDPALFRCGIDWIGVTDIKLLYENHWGYESDASDATLTVSLPTMVGDPATDGAALETVSPLRQAARIRQPLLLAYGERDRRVPIFHGIKFRDEVKKTNANVEWVVYPEEGHGWALQKNQIDFWSRVEKFLDKHIGH